METVANGSKVTGKGNCQTEGLQRDADVAYNTVKRIYKNPYHVITTDTLGKLAKALGVPLGELLEEVPDPPELREQNTR